MVKSAVTKQNPYIISGLGLLIAGGLISIPSYFIFNVIWLTALGICLLILSGILIALGKAVPKLPPEVCALLLETGINNTAALIEELGIKARAIYLPSSLAGDRPQAFIPLQSNGKRPEITRALPQRLITRYGNRPEDIGLLISTVGSTAIDLLESTPGATADELAAALTSLFAGRLGVANGATVARRDNHIMVEINKPRIENGTSWSHHCLGGPLATVVASVAAEAWNKPVTISREEPGNGKYYVELEVMS